MKRDLTTSQNSHKNIVVFFPSAPILLERQPQKTYFTCWLALQVLLHHPWLSSWTLQPILTLADAGMGVNGGGGQGEGAGYGDKVGDCGHPTLLLETPRRNSEGEFFLGEPDPARPSMIPHKTSYGLKSTCFQSSGAAAPFLLKSFH